ncbi:hypothetical protein BH09ACT5_BH09ACT5_01590 [soil metagenome]
MFPAAAFGLWLLALSLQLADLGTARFDARLLARGTRTVVRLHPVAWVVPLAALVIVGLGLGLDWEARLLFDERDPLAAVVVAIILLVGIVAAWLAITAAATRPAADSYRALRDELVDLAGTRVQQERLDEMQGRLAAIDADRDRTPPPRSASTRAVALWVFQRPQRVLPVLAGVLLLVVTAIAAAENAGRGWTLVVAIVAVVLSTVLAIAGARASLVLLNAVRETQVEYRAEVVHLLAEAEKTSKKPVAGLGERVSRALQILREQQG